MNLNLLLMALLFFISLHGLSVAQPSNVVFAAQRYLIGDPNTLSIQKGIVVGGHSLTLSRWKSPHHVDQVLPVLMTQLPEETVAWGDDISLQMHWMTSTQSHILILRPDGDNVVEFSISTLELGKDGDPTVAQDESYFNSLKQTFVAKRLGLSLLMDIQDETDENASKSLLYASTLPLTELELVLRNILTQEKWTLAESVQQARGATAPRSMTATHRNFTLRLDLLEHLGRTFMYVNLSGETQL